MPLFYRIAADITVAVHMAYALFIVLGQLAIMLGALRGWNWIRNMTFRVVHVMMILIVVFESLTGITCPLTTFEKFLRSRAGQASYRGDFLANWVHNLLFFEFSPATFTIIYSACGALVLLTLVLAPPRRKVIE